LNEVTDGFSSWRIIEDRMAVPRRKLPQKASPELLSIVTNLAINGDDGIYTMLLLYPDAVGDYPGSYFTANHSAMDRDLVAVDLKDGTIKSFFLFDSLVRFAYLTDMPDMPFYIGENEVYYYSHGYFA